MYTVHHIKFTDFIQTLFCFCQDYDPPSEGQVIGGPRLSAHHDPVLSLLARIERGPLSQLQQPEVSCDLTGAFTFTNVVQINSFFELVLLKDLVK